MNKYPKSIVFVASFVLVYIILCIGLWVYNNVNSYSEKRRLLQEYAQKYNQDLKVEVFGKAYKQAQICNDLQISSEKEQCQKNLSHDLGVVIYEDELKGNTYDWPHDLFFVKRVNDDFQLLDWSGKLKYFSTGADINRINSKIPYWIQFLGRNCHYFTFDNFASCEAYEMIPISANETGYIVRLMPFGEEEDFYLTFVLPIFGVVLFLVSLTRMDSEGISMIIFSLPFFIALAISIFITKKYSR